MIILCIYVLFSTTTTFAQNFRVVHLETSKEVIKAGEEVEISFHMTQEKVAAYFATITFDEEKLECISESEAIHIEKNEVKIVWYDEQGGKEARQGEIGKLTFKAKQEGTANIVIRGEFYNQEAELINTDFEGVEVKIEGENLQEDQGSKEENENSANLQLLSINQEGLVPNFEKEILEYDLVVSENVENLEILLDTESPRAKVEMIGNENFKEGINIVIIRVTSENGSKTKEYKIRVTKTRKVEDANANLEILAVENALLNPAFDSHVTKYQVEIANGIFYLPIFAVPENEEGRIVIEGNENLQEGNNLIKVMVTAPNGITKREYQIDVYQRNKEEEKRYEEEKEKNIEQLQKAYEATKVAVKQVEEQNEDEIETVTKNNREIVAITFFIALILTIGIFIYIKKHKKINKN